MSRASFELREGRWARDLGTYAPAIQAFADHLAGLDYRADTVMRLASAARHYCVWLRLSKVAPGEISDEVVARFTRHRCRCLGRQRSAPRIAINFERRVRQFVRFLAKDPAERPRNAQADDPRIEAYRTWMRLHRGLSENTICDHEKVLRRTLPLLGHASIQSTEIYLRADPTEKLEALAKLAPPTLQRGRFKAPDKLLAMLQDVSHRKNYAE